MRVAKVGERPRPPNRRPHHAPRITCQQHHVARHGHGVQRPRVPPSQVVVETLQLRPLGCPWRWHGVHGHLVVRLRRRTRSKCFGLVGEPRWPLPPRPLPHGLRRLHQRMPPVLKTLTMSKSNSSKQARKQAPASGPWLLMEAPVKKTECSAASKCLYFLYRASLEGRMQKFQLWCQPSLCSTLILQCYVKLTMERCRNSITDNQSS